MKNVDKSAYFEDFDLLTQPRERRNAQLANRKIFARKQVMEELDLTDLYNIDVSQTRISYDNLAP
jgi:hypothetical protein